MFKKLEALGIPRNYAMMDLVMLFGAFITFLNSTIIAPALPSIMHEMSINASTAQWLTTVFMLVSGIMIPVSAFLLSRFTTRTLFMVSMGIYTLGTFTAGIATTFPTILTARILQAIGAGVLMPMSQTLVLITIPKDLRGIGMGMIGLVMGFAPAFGPVAGGFIIDAFNWHMLFYILTPLALLTILFAYFSLENVGEPSDAKLDPLSVIESTLGFGGLLYGFSVIGSSGFTWYAFVSLLVGSVTIVIFFKRQLAMEEPMLNVRILQNKKFLISVLLTMLVNAAFIVGGILNPIYIQDIRGYGASMSGLIMLPSAIASALISPLSGHWFDKYGPRILAVPGLVMVLLFTLPMANMTIHTSLIFLCTIYTIRIFGLTLVNMPINTWGLNALTNKEISHGTAIGNTFRQMAGSLGTAILVTVMSLTIAEAEDPATAAAQIHGINMAFFGACIIIALALILAIIYVKDDDCPE